MANEYFTESSVPSTGGSLASATIRNEFIAIGDGFDKLPTMSGNGGKLIAVNGAATALEAIATGSGIATFLGLPSSANLRSAVTDETGTGALVFATSPTLVTPTLGVASATSINKVAITAPASSATLTIADGKTLTSSVSMTLGGGDSSTLSIAASKTLTASNTLTFTGTDGSTLNVGTGGTLGAAALLAGAGTTYTPTLTETSNCSGSSVNAAYYIRLGSVVVVGVHVSLTVTSGGGAATALDITLPVASNLGGSDAVGIGWSGVADTLRVSADLTNDRVQANWEASANGLTSLGIIFIYSVI